MKVAITILLSILSVIGFGQKLSDDLQPFNKLIIDPYINVELVKGNKEKIEITYHNIAPHEIFAEQRGKTLHVYLEDARVGLRLFRDNNFVTDKYENASVRMVITYVEIKNIQFRGEEKLVCNDDLAGKKIKIKAFGETDIRFASVNAQNFKVALYGENDLFIEGGQSGNQVINTYGNNSVNTKNLLSYGIKTTNFGESKLEINATDYLKVTYFGEGELHYHGHPYIERKWLIGEVDVRNIY